MSVMHVYISIFTIKPTMDQQIVGLLLPASMLIDKLRKTEIGFFMDSHFLGHFGWSVLAVRPHRVSYKVRFTIAYAF